MSAYFWQCIHPLWGVTISHCLNTWHNSWTHLAAADQRPWRRAGRDEETSRASCEYAVSRDQLATPYSWCASNGDFNGARLGAILDYRSYSPSSPSLSRWLPLPEVYSLGSWHDTDEPVEPRDKCINSCFTVNFFMVPTASWLCLFRHQ